MTSVNDLRLDDYRQDRRIARWLDIIGVTNAVVPHQNVRETLRFFSRVMPMIPPAEALSYLVAMDLSKPVTKTELAVGTELLGFRERASGTKGDTRPDLRAKFYSFSGASPHRLGIRVGTRMAVHYRVHTKCPALASWASGALDYWTGDSANDRATQTYSSIKLNTTGVHALGGDRQLLIPQAWRFLQIVP